MNEIGHQAAAIHLGPPVCTVVCLAEEYRAPIYICYDRVCQRCPREDLGNRLVYLPRQSADPDHNPPPRVYSRFYHDSRYQVYAVNEYGMPPQQSRAGVCSFWCHHDIEYSPPIQRAWYNRYYGQFSNAVGEAPRDDSNQVFIAPISGQDIIFGPPAVFTTNQRVDGPADDPSEDATSVQSFRSESSSNETPSLGHGSEKSRASASPGLPSTPRSMYHQTDDPAATYSLPAVPHVEETMERVELEDLRHGGAVVVAEMVDNDRTPTRDTFGGGGEDGGDVGTPTPRRMIRRLHGAYNGMANVNPPLGPRVRGAGRGRGWGGRPTRIRNWRTGS
ncbi:hypothetical protein DSL72_008189 [Monilinia vaccinii-corymbosi]|uniref:Uncharacterized protein n=1 Tax=Monilinia vaccinii-corymbosi TaxID=61207 RepID=A0A8A3PJQ2_9HELO|nr:hypothetical protein DSL72_008189 [Monilinia vaccinii-corymbosi]